jgi:hypothetical protein
MVDLYNFNVSGDNVFASRETIQTEPQEIENTESKKIISYQ